MHGAGAHALAIPGIIATLEGWAADPSKIKTEDIKGVISGASGLLKPAWPILICCKSLYLSKVYSRAIYSPDLRLYCR
jgi:hypothetical protein